MPSAHRFCKGLGGADLALHVVGFLPFGQLRCAQSAFYLSVAPVPRRFEKLIGVPDRVDMCPVSDTFVPAPGQRDGPLTAARSVFVV